MVSLVYGTDPHVSDTAPVSRKDDWTETILGKIDQVLGICKEVNADASIWNGDIFNIKQPDRNSYRLVNRMLRMFNATPWDNYANVGNHDVKFGDYKFLPDQPLETLYAGGAFKRLYDSHEAYFDAGLVEVRVVGVPYHGKRYDLDRIRSFKKGKETHLVLCAHLLATDGTGDMFDKEDVLKYKELPELNPDVDVWMFGHWHKNQGIKELSNGAKVVNIGSLSRGALSEDNITRIPSCAVLKFHPDRVTIQERKLVVEDSDKIFDLEKRADVERMESQMDDFVDKIQTTLEASSERASFEDKIKSMEIPDKVREKALHYHQLAETSK